MSEELIISKSENKVEKYETLIPQLKALIEGEPNLISNLANIAAAIKESFNFFWVGFYLVDQEELVLGPFQGPIACTRIQKGSGVCGKAWDENETIIVEDVDQFPGHIACSANSKSEIVIPGIKNGKTIFVLDIDSDQLGQFDNIDQKFLEQIVELIITNPDRE